MYIVELIEICDRDTYLHCSTMYFSTLAGATRLGTGDGDNGL